VDDCLDGDATVFPGAVEINDGQDNQCPGEPGYGSIDELPGTSGFVGGTAEEYCWTAQPGATGYEVLRSATPDFSSGCIRIPTTDTCVTDAELPPAGAAWYYLARPTAPFPGSYGQASDGSERVPSCP
jgi:hypothetical protein